jgi:cyclopropane fatty-acyl-phospholipid synthase-like methyltransferase
MLTYLFPLAYELAFKVPPDLIWRKKSLKCLARELRSLGVKPRRILDVGCGAGVLTPVMRRLFPDSQITGIDKSVQMTGLAERKYGRIARFEVLDFFDCRSEYELIVGFYSFQFFSLARAIQKIEQLLSPSGVCLIVTTGRAPFSVIHQFLVHKFLRTRLHLYSPASFCRVLSGTGLSLRYRVIDELEGSYVLVISRKNVLPRNRHKPQITQIFTD